MPAYQRSSSSIPTRDAAAGAVGPGRSAGVGNAERVARLLDVAMGRDARPVDVVARSGEPGVDPDALDVDAEGGGVTAHTLGGSGHGGKAIDPVVAPAPSTDGSTPAPPDYVAGIPESISGGASTQVKEVHAKNAARLADATLHATLSPAQAEELKVFVRNWNKNKARYQDVAARTSMPAALIAALHWRESSGDFSTYLHQGDPLGKKAVHVPSDIPIFHVWEDAAVHALTMKAGLRDQLAIDGATKDAGKLATFSEYYNGLGYHNREQTSPYAFAGTSAYSKGKYVADGRFSANTKDQQLGTVVMMDAIDGVEQDLPATAPSGPTGWASLQEGRTLSRGARGPLVVELQRRLVAAGFPAGSDGAFGPTVEKNVKAFQKARGLPVDGQVGAGTAAALEPAAGRGTTPAPAPAPTTPRTTGGATPRASVGPSTPGRR